jgi:hypothetical protein
MNEMDEAESSRARARIELPAGETTKTLHVMRSKFDLMSIATCDEIGAVGGFAAPVGGMVDTTSAQGVARCGEIFDTFYSGEETYIA